MAEYARIRKVEGDKIMKNDRMEFKKSTWGVFAFCALFIFASVPVLLFLPSDEKEVSAVEEVVLQEPVEEAVAVSDDIFPDVDLNEYLESNKNRDDSILVLYRQPQSRAAVEWFFSHITNDRDIALAILDSADEFDIPVSLAFALAHTESSYKATAVHRNTNGSTDRGLFQLNNNSFPNLKEDDFYNPKISAYYGMSHLRFCLNTAGNEIAALAMYNAGTNKVRNNNTPQRTLNYISQIESYRGLLEEHFASEVLAFYNVDLSDSLLAKK